MKLKTTLFGTSALLVATSSYAVTIGGSFGLLLDSEGNQNAGPMRTMVIIDTNDDGLLGLADWNGSSFTPGNDEYDFGWDELTGDGDGFEASFPGNFGVLGVPTGYAVNLGDRDGTVTSGDDVYLFWFPGLDPAAEAPGVGQEYGYIKIGELPQENIGTVSPLILNPFSSVPNPQYGSTIPEPTSLALLGLGGLLVARRRRA